MGAAAEILGVALVVLGALFFLAGTLGLIRFGDLRSRMHALTKADNLGLGLTLAGAALLIGSWTTAAVLGLTWILTLAAASVSAHVIAPVHRRDGAAEHLDGAGPPEGGDAR